VEGCIGHDLRLGAGQRGIGGEARGGRVGGRRDGAAFAPAHGQEREAMTSVTESRMSVMMSAMPALGFKVTGDG
jgi:hypothetical protein